MLSSLKPIGSSLQRRVPALSRKPFQFTLAMNLNCGIVGLPNVGKSTLFNALVGSEAAQAANFPFCTIGRSCLVSFCMHMMILIYEIFLFAEPNVGLVNVPDTRLDKLGVINKSVKVVPAVVRLSHLLQLLMDLTSTGNVGKLRWSSWILLAL